MRTTTSLHLHGLALDQLLSLPKDSLDAVNHLSSFKGHNDFSTSISRHRHCTDGGSSRQGRGKRLLVILILILRCTHSAASAASSQLFSNTGQDLDICFAPLPWATTQCCPRITPLPSHKWHCCHLSAARACRHKRLFFHGLLTTRHLHLPLRHRMIALRRSSPGLGQMSPGFHFLLISMARIAQQLPWQPRAN